MKLSDEIITLLNEMIDEGYINKSDHPTLDLSIYKYNNSCVYNSMWNEITLLCRGLILNSNYEIVGNCMPKFFNYNESNAYNPQQEEGYKIYPKVDGSLIQVFRYNGKIVVSSSGSLDPESEYIKKAKRILLNSNIDIRESYTYIFELISPFNRIVVDYKGEEFLTLLTIRSNNVIGVNAECNLNCFNIPYSNEIRKLEQMKLDLNTVTNMINDSDFNNEEGFVVLFESNNRIKMKFNSYVKLHGILSHLNEGYIIDCFFNDVNIFQLDLPNEYFDYITDVINKIKTLKNQLEEESELLLTECKKLDTRKEQALLIKSNKNTTVQSIVFSKLSNKDYKQVIKSYIEQEIKKEGV